MEITLAQATVPESVSDAMVILMPIAKNPNGLLFKAKYRISRHSKAVIPCF